MKPKKKRFGQASLLLAILLAMAALSACGSKNTAAPAAESTQTAEAQTEATQTETETATAALSENADAETDTASTGKGPIKEADMENPEPVQYEGIDLTSTMPGFEWVKSSFPGVITSPKFVIYNDATNYKVIAEDGQRIKFHRDDVLLDYIGLPYIPQKNLGHFQSSGEDFRDSEAYVYLNTHTGLDDETWSKGEMEVSFFARKKNPEGGEWMNGTFIHNEDLCEKIEVTLVFVDSDDADTTGYAAFQEPEVKLAKDKDFENPEPTVYDGIDLDSPMSTFDWAGTSFPGVMEPFKFVVYNDDTHYRVIVENEQRIKFHRDDHLLLFQKIPSTPGSSRDYDFEGTKAFKDPYIPFYSADTTGSGFTYSLQDFHLPTKEALDEGELIIAAFSEEDVSDTESYEPSFFATLVFVD